MAVKIKCPKIFKTLKKKNTQSPKQMINQSKSNVKHLNLKKKIITNNQFKDDD